MNSFVSFTEDNTDSISPKINYLSTSPDVFKDFYSIIDYEEENEVEIRLKHKIVKVQKQYTGSESQLLSILNLAKNQSLTTKYELIVSCSLQKTVELFEYLFNDNGKIISISK